MLQMCPSRGRVFIAFLSGYQTISAAAQLSLAVAEQDGVMSQPMWLVLHWHKVLSIHLLALCWTYLHPLQCLLLLFTIRKELHADQQAG